MSKTRLKSEARHKKRNELTTSKKRPRQFLQTPHGNALTTDFVEHLADFLAGRLPEQPDMPPRVLREPIRQLDNFPYLALATLAPLLDAIETLPRMDNPFRLPGREPLSKAQPHNGHLLAWHCPHGTAQGRRWMHRRD